MKRVMLFFFAAFGTLLFSLWLYAAVNLSDYDDSDVYRDCRKIWSSRGLYDAHTPRNSLESVAKAFAAGAPGVEIDFHYDPDLDRFVLSHAHPKIGPDGRRIYHLKNGRLQTLGELFAKLGKGHWFWLDYKNLGDLDAITTRRAIARLKSITPPDLRRRIYIESDNPLRLKAYADAGFPTLFDIQPLPEKYGLTWPVITAYKAVFAWGGFQALTMRHGKKEAPVYGEKTRRLTGKIPIFLYHVPDDRPLLEKLLADPKVRVLLVGRDQSLDRFDLTGCKETP